MNVAPKVSKDDDECQTATTDVRSDRRLMPGAERASATFSRVAPIPAEPRPTGESARGGEVGASEAFISMSLRPDLSEGAARRCRGVRRFASRKAQKRFGL